MSLVTMPAQLSLEGDPPFSLLIGLKNDESYHTDLQSYRPDPRMFLKRKKMYRGEAQFLPIYTVDG